MDEKKLKLYIRILVPIVIIVTLLNIVWVSEDVRNKEISEAKAEEAERAQTVSSQSVVWDEALLEIPPLSEVQEAKKATEKKDAGKVQGESTQDEEEYLILVNKNHGVKRSYKPEDLVKVKFYADGRPDSCRYMREKAATAFNMLSEAAKKAGYDIKITTAYRSYEYQTLLYNRYTLQDGKDEADKYSARPGYSEHQTGLCTDVSSPGANYMLTEAYGKMAEGKWLAENAHKFGYIIRYPKGKEDITGYTYEPWHIRYVGKKVAGEIYKKGITLEEYLGEN